MLLAAVARLVGREPPGHGIRSVSADGGRYKNMQRMVQEMADATGYHMVDAKGMARTARRCHHFDCDLGGYVGRSWRRIGVDRAERGILRYARKVRRALSHRGMRCCTP